MKKVLVIGLDGATWDLIKPWAEQGKLPTIKKLMKECVYGDLKSTIPPITGPAWTSFATGKNPGKHGCPDFIIPKTSLIDIKSISTECINGITFYEILNEKGKKCIIINLPVSDPPRINGTVISSFLSKSDEYIFPPDLIKEVPELKNYRLYPNVSLSVDGKIMEYITDIRNLEETRFKCAKKLFKKEWDFFFLLFSGSDWIQHVAYDKLNPGAIEGDLALNSLKAFEEIDGYINWFMENTSHSQELITIIMSDHGFKKYKGIFYINSWLKKEKYIKVESGTKARVYPHKLGEESDKVKSYRINIRIPIFLLRYFKSLDWAFPIYTRLKKKLPLETRVNLQPKLSETFAYSLSTKNSGFGGIYINDKNRFENGIVESKEEYEEIRCEIINKLKQLKDPETGDYVMNCVVKREDIYSGDCLGTSPDIIFMSEEYLISKSLVFSKKFIHKNLEVNGHALNGIFLAYGSDIKKGVEIKKANICDIAPTILHISGIPIPKDMDGRVLKEIFKEDDELSKRKVIYQEVDKNKKIKETARKLKKMGKI